MLGQFEDMIIDKLVQQLNTHGVNVTPETVKKAVTNSPQIVAQIQGILLATTSEDRLEKIKLLIQQAAGTSGTTTTTTAGSKTTTNKTT